MKDMNFWQGVAVTLVVVLIGLIISLSIDIVKESARNERASHLELVRRTHTMIFEAYDGKDSTKNVAGLIVYGVFLDSLEKAIDGD